MATKASGIAPTVPPRHQQRDKTDEEHGHPADGPDINELDVGLGLDAGSDRVREAAAPAPGGRVEGRHERQRPDHTHRGRQGDSPPVPPQATGRERRGPAPRWPAPASQCLRRRRRPRRWTAAAVPPRAPAHSRSTLLRRAAEIPDALRPTSARATAPAAYARPGSAMRARSRKPTYGAAREKDVTATTGTTTATAASASGSQALAGQVEVPRLPPMAPSWRAARPVGWGDHPDRRGRIPIHASGRSGLASAHEGPREAAVHRGAGVRAHHGLASRVRARRGRAQPRPAAGDPGQGHGADRADGRSTSSTRWTSSPTARSGSSPSGTSPPTTPRTGT